MHIEIEVGSILNGRLLEDIRIRVTNGVGRELQVDSKSHRIILLRHYYLNNKSILNYNSSLDTLSIINRRPFLGLAIIYNVPT